MTVRDIAADVGIGKYSVSKIMIQQKNFGTVSPKRKSKYGRKAQDHTSNRQISWFRPRFARRSGGEPIREQHLIQTVKYPQKQMFGGYFTSGGPGCLVPVEGMVNSKPVFLKLWGTPPMGA
ncbi:hypothetical protein TNCV_958301 [Trichonephila clavipes]|nr:hypothetical protein TNCV_958301 [Trichonephila clavipes]